MSGERTPSSTCCSDPSPTWTKAEVLWKLHLWTSPSNRPIQGQAEGDGSRFAAGGADRGELKSHAIVALHQEWTGRGDGNRIKDFVKPPAPEHQQTQRAGGGRQEAQASPGAGDHHQMMRQDGLDCQMFYQTAVASALLCSGLCGAGSIKRGGLPSVAEQHSISGAALVTGCCLCPAPLTDWGDHSSPTLCDSSSPPDSLLFPALFTRAVYCVYRWI